MKKPISLKLLVRLFAILSITSISVEAQNNCPSLPKKSNFDTLTFIKTETPTDPSKATGIWLGQGTILRNGTEKRPAFIPSNRPTWAIAIAHAWNYHRNIIKRVNYPKIGYWMATMVQESELGCVDDNVWDAPYKISANQVKATTIMYHTGCYQIEGPGSAYGQLNQNYPYGRFPINSYKAFMEGRDNMETSSLVKSYFDVYTPYVYNYIKGWKLYESIDCTKDPLAYEKSSASGYNGGINLFANASNFFNRSQDNNACWAGLPATMAGYGEDIAKWTSVLEDMKNYCQYPTGSTFDSYYNVAIKWSDITNYLTIINKIYPEINFATKVIPNVQKAFEKIAGSTTGTIPFKQLGPVIDQIILSLPAEYPQTVEGSPIGSLKCSGKTIPYGHFEILNGSNNFCLGNSVTLNLVVDGGGGTATTFKWYKGSVSPANQIANTQSVTITPTSTGTFVYTAEICNSDGCYQVNTNSSTSGCLDSRNILGVQIKVNQCSSCSTLVSATSVNTPCKGMAKGQINLTITNPPANYKVSYKGTTPTGNFSGSFNASGSTASIKNVRDGAYNIIIEDLSNGTCKAYTNVIVGFTTLINEYVKAKITSTAACKANLQADIIKLPSPCRWKVEAFAPVYFQWENWMNIGISTSTGASSLEKWTNFYPKPSAYDQYSDAQVFEGYYYLASDESMTINMAVTNTPGASQLFSYKVNIYDDANKLVKTYDVPAGSAKGDQPYTVGTYTVTCPFTPPNAYNFTWNPTINNQTNTASKSTGNVNVSSTNDVMYTVTATNTTNTQCVLNDSVKVLKDPSCAPVCTKPTDVISLNATNSTLTGCSPTTGKIETNTLTNGLAYQWYFDGGSGYTAYTGTGNNGTVSGNKVTLSNLTQNGNYRLRLAGLSSDMNTATCYVEQTFAVSITTTPSKPSISGTSTYCESDNISLTANKGNTTDLVTTWEWKLGTTILSGNTASYSKLNAVIADGGSYTLVAKNGSCSSTASSALAVTVTAKPTFTITSPPSQCGGSVDLATTYSNLSAGTMKYYNDALATTLLGSSIVSTSGSYYLQATSGTCKSSIQTVVVSFKSPPVPPTVQAINYCKDVTASALTATGTALKWYADNLSSTSISTPTPNTSTVGTIDYYVTQTVNGCESNRTKLTVTINPLPNTNVTSNITQCGGNLDLATLTTATGTKKFYTDTLSTELSNTLVSSSGTYYLQVTSTSGCKSKFALGKINVQINTPPTANITTTGNDLNYCQTATGVTLTATLVSGAKYEWFKGGVSQGAATTSNTFSNASKGNWTLKVTNTSTNCSSTSTGVSVVENPRPSLTNSNLLQTICSGNASTSITLTSDVASTFAWTSTASAGTISGFSASGTGNIPTQTITNSGTAQGTVTYQIIPTANGCNGNATNYIIRIDPNPTATVSSITVQNCSSTQTLPGVQPTFGTVTWKKLSGNGTIDKPATYNSSLNGLNPSESGTFQMEVLNGVCPVAKSSVVTVTRTADESPSVSLSVDKTQVCEGSQIVFTANANGGNATTRTFTFLDANNPTVILQGPSTNNKYITNASAPISVQVQMTANSICLASGANDTPISDAATVKVDKNPEPPSAGPSKSICADQFTLEGSAPVSSSAVGKWSLLSGNGTFVDISSPNTVVKDLAEGANTYRWEVTNGLCPPLFADVTITRFANPTIANAGANQIICENSSLNLNANPANASKGETGKWSSIGITFADATKPNTNITNTPKGIHVLEWRIGNGICPDSKDTMTIYVDAKPSTAALSGNSLIETCANPTSLSAQSPSLGTGTWTKVNPSENGTIATVDVNNPTASVIGLVNGTQSTFRWTVSNGSCNDPSNFVEQTIRKLSDLTAAEIYQNTTSLSENQEIIACLGNNSLSLSASSPLSDEEGIWTVSGTSASIASLSSTTPNISLNSVGKTTLTWSTKKLLGGACPASTRSIVISVLDVPISSGVISGDVSACANATKEYSYTLVTNADSYVWTVPNGASVLSGNNSNIVSIRFGDTEGNITVTPSNQCGNASSSSSLAIGLTTVPTEAVNISGDFSPCASQTAEPYIANTTATGVQFIWSSTIGTLNSADANALLDLSTNSSANGTIKVQLSNNCGLGSSNTATIQTVFALVPSVLLVSDKKEDKFCIGQSSATLTATGINGGNNPIYTFALNGVPQLAINNQLSLNPTQLASGATITVEMQSNETCLANPSNNKATASLQLIGINGPNPSINSNINTVCEKDPQGIVVNAFGEGDLPVIYQWLKDGNIVTNTNQNSLKLTLTSQTGQYQISMNDGLCPTVTSPLSPLLVINARPVIETNPKVEIEISADGKTPVLLNAKVSPTSSVLNWTGENIVGDIDKNTLTIALSKEAVYSYTLTATDNNCSSSQTVEVVANLPLKIPNAFTPNGDGLNDTWTFVGLVDYAYLKVTIFNRWGNIVFRKEGEQLPPWDGSSNNGAKLETGTYYYLLEAQKNNGQNITLDGSVTILQ